MAKTSLELIVGNIWNPREERIEMLRQDNDSLPNAALHSLNQKISTPQQIVTKTSISPEISAKVDKPNLESIIAQPINISTNVTKNEQSYIKENNAVSSKQLILEWQHLVSEIHSCRDCKLCDNRTHVVIERGNRTAKWMFVGEGPGEQEDIQGKPFVGASGQLLDKMIAAMKLDSEKDVYIANVVKCRPPKNRNPEPEEIQACNHYLKSQIEMVKPAIIITLGRFAAQTLLNTDKAVGKLRNEVHSYKNIPVIVTYHPSYLLRTPTAKKDAWQDLQLAMSVSTQNQL